MLTEEESEWPPGIEERVATRDDDRDRAGEIFQLRHGASRAPMRKPSQEVFADQVAHLLFHRILSKPSEMLP
jgi:hypothetical protein